MQQEFSARRQALLEQMSDKSIAIIQAAPECLRNGDSHYRFRQNSDFYYLTGFNEPESVAVFIPSRKEGQYILFNREKDPKAEVWTGPRVGQEAACQAYGADQAFSMAELDNKLPELLQNCQRVYYAIGREQDFDNKIMAWVDKVRKKAR